MTALQKTVWGLAAIGLTFLLAITANFWHAYRLNEVKNWTLHTHQVIEELKDTLISLEEVETCARGYIISGKPVYRDGYELGKNGVMIHMKRVTEMVADHPDQLARMTEAREMALRKIAYTEHVMDLKAHNLPNPDMGKGKGTAIMGRFKAIFNAMTDEEERLLTARSAALLNIQRTNWIATALLGIFTMVMLAWVYNLVRQAISEEQARVLALSKEIEERKRVEADLLATTARLASSNTDLQQFAYVASHDLQEPLRAVAGFLTLIISKNKGKFDEETEGWMNHAVEGAQRMRTLIHDLLAYARVESQGKALVKTNCNDALQRARKDLRVLLDESGAKINSDKLPVVMGDEGQLGQLFQNLISNAIKFRSAAAPEINIGVGRRDNDWLFTIKDNGIGFDDQHAKRIFIIFQRLHGRDEYKGTGIGLALCKKIVERHGGQIWAQSQPGQGATFSFTIPVDLKQSPGETISGNPAQSIEKEQSSENSPH